MPTCRWQKQRAEQNLTVSAQEIDEENHCRQRKHPTEDADQEPEMPPAQLKQSIPAPSPDRGSPASLIDQSVCTHMTPPG
jgi:hypothetical protein